jgi:N-terminal domain of NWD NACHT-NTPase
LLKPGEQEESRVKGLDRIASIIRECSLRETIYQDRYESTSNKKIENRITISHKQYRECIKSLYSEIIIFQATYICYLSDQNTVERWIQDIANWQNWDSKIKTITQKNEDLKALDQHWRDNVQQEQWKVMTMQHDESIKKLDYIGKEISRFYKLVSEAKMQEEREGILGWLQTVMPSDYYDAAVAKREKYATGKWFLESDYFTNWKKQSNSFLWLVGKGMSVIPYQFNSRLLTTG